MLNIRRSEDRGVSEHGWLSSRHTFSFAGYHDPAFTGYRDLLVINEDRVAPGQGFGTHGHRDMEILSYVLSGALEHADSIGTGSVIVPGEVQRMSAGTGVRHSEYNHSKSEPVHFLQIWIRPSERNLPPSYEQKSFAAQDKQNRLRLVASQDGRDGSLTVHQNVSVYAAVLEPGATVTFDRRDAPEFLPSGASGRRDAPAGRHVWLHVARGQVKVGGHELGAGDALSSDDAGALAITGIADAEVLLFDLA